MNIRIYNSNDKNACLAIFDSNCPPYFDKNEKDDLIQWLDKEDRLDYYVLENEGEILASGGLYRDTEKNEVGFAWGMVSKAHHGKGLGTRLALYRINEAERSYPNHDLKLETSQLTRAFYAKHGFKETSHEKDGFGPGIDKVTMYRFDSRLDD